MILFSVLPIHLRKIFAKPIQFIYSNSDLINDANAFYYEKERELLKYKQEFIKFSPSLTSQLILNFISKEQEELYISNHSNLSFEKKKDIVLAKIFEIMCIFLNQKYDSNNLNFIILDFFTKIDPKYGENPIKYLCVNKLNQRLSMSREQVNKINHIISNYPELLSDEYLKEFENDKISTVFLVIIKDIYSYTKLEFSNHKPMVYFLNEIEKIKKLKEDINNI